MNLKSKIAFRISLLFTLIFAFSAALIYSLYADFRKDEFENRLNEKAISTIKLLVDVKEIDTQLLKLIDKNSIHKLYNEKTLIFDANYNLIYSSLDDTPINWSKEDLKQLKKEKTFFRMENDNEVHGFFYDTKDHDFYALVSAHDTYGRRKLTYLLYILIISYIVFTGLSWILTYSFVKKMLAPLDAFHQQIKNISESDLTTKIAVKRTKDEIDLLAVEFNHMLERINEAYRKQQEFTANASHELRTPIARIIAKLENRIIEARKKQIEVDFDQQLLSEVNYLSELTNSLILLSKLDTGKSIPQEICRIDEVLFDAAEAVNKNYHDFKMDFSMNAIEHIEVPGFKSLLTIAFVNLFKNAYLYSTTKIAHVQIEEKAHQLIITVSNDGTLITPADQKKLFDPFMRGENAKNKSGLGLGLRIVKRIFNQQNATIAYAVNKQQENTFVITFLI
jgi:signal transduction histidine kinase